MTEPCPRCGAEPGPRRHAFLVCDACGHHFPLSARSRIAMLLDDRSFVETAADLESADPLLFQDTMPYPERLAQARDKTALTEAVVTGIGRLNGREAVVAVLDFDFLGGTMGTVVGERVALAMELALKRRLPFISVASSGGARMQ